MQDARGTPAPDHSRAAARPPRHRRAIWIGARLALIAAFAGATYMALLPLGRVGGGGAVASPGFYPIGSGVGDIEIGQRAPDFDGTGSPGSLLVDLDGGPVHLADFAGQPLWIVFWATWCAPCQQEVSDIRAAYHAHGGDGLAVLAIDIQEPAASVRAYAQANDLDYMIGLDPIAAVMDLYRARGLPSHYFVDGAGLVRARYFGQLTRDLMEQYLAVITRG
jgi:cytochrome c biogenesis protein CcmG/thiol:disulfide interchange protein DsbE